VAVSPNAAGEGVETITVSQSGGGSATVTLGFYVAGSHSCFLAQSYDGAYNAGKADLAAVATWVNLGSSALNVTQATGSAQPTYRTSCAGDSPCIRFDGGDNVKASTAADWTFMNTGVDFSVLATAKTAIADPNSLRVLMATAAVLGSTGSRGFTAYYDDRTASSINNKIGWTISSGAALNINVLSANGDFSGAAWHVWEAIENDDAGAGIDGFQWVDNAAVGGAAVSGAYSASAATSPLTIGDEGTARTFAWSGDMGDILIYSSALTDTQRGINQAVADWASGSSQINLASATWLFIGDSLTIGSGGVTTWPTKLLASAPAGTVFTNRAASSNTAAQILAQWRAAGVPTRVFVLGGVNDIAVGTSAVATFASLSPIYSEASALGVNVVAQPTLPFGNAASWSAPDQVQLEALEVSIVADVNVDILVNWYDLMGQGGTPEDLAAIYDNGDGVHPNEAGTTFMAATMVTALGL
jgi:lysophospholipase L1-like esterase